MKKGKPHFKFWKELDLRGIDENLSEEFIQTEETVPRKKFVLSFSDIWKSIAILVIATTIGFVFFQCGFKEANIIAVYILGVLIISVVTTHRIYSLISSLVSVLIYNFFFTYPKFTFLAYDQGYPVTFLIMFIVAFITGTLAIQLKNTARQATRAAYRTQILLDTNQLLQQAHDRVQIVTAMANQFIKLLGEDVIVYLDCGGKLGTPYIFSSDGEKKDESCITEEEQKAAFWVLKHNKRAGAGTKNFPELKHRYMAIRSNEEVYGVVGIVMEDIQIDAFVNSIILAILGECALALESEKNAREKEEAAILARNEQLRANLLRAISHDLRTPLTSISGNASNLMTNGKQFDEKTKMSIYTDIYDDSMWLINLVENLLAVTRIEEGRMNLKLSAELIDEVISEALRHVNRKSVEHEIVVKSEQEFILAKIDARLMVQTIINIVDNAIKYTPKGSIIVIETKKKGGKVEIEIADNGPGISDEVKSHVFEMFYSGSNKVADSRRSLGLGLSLCKSIVNAHEGEIKVSDNHPHGTIFTIILPVGEVQLHE